MDSSPANPDNPRTLAEERRDLVATRIVDAAMACFSDVGLEATVEDIADRAGVSKRTIFRHFGSRETVLAEGIEALQLRFQAEVIQLLEPDGPLEEWVERSCITMHRLFRELLGVGWLDLHRSVNVAPALQETLDARSPRRRDLTERFAASAWRAAGGKGKVPPRLIRVLAVCVSAFGAQSLSIDFDVPVEDAGRLSSDLVLTVLREELALR